MKIERIDTVSYIRALKMKNSFNAREHDLAFAPNNLGCLIDEYHLIPFSNILEIVIAPSTVVPESLSSEARVNYKRALKQAKAA